LEFADITRELPTIALMIGVIGRNVQLKPTFTRSLTSVDEVPVSEPSVNVGAGGTPPTRAQFATFVSRRMSAAYSARSAGSPGVSHDVGCEAA
jgi:hypothetical protein